MANTFARAADEAEQPSEPVQWSDLAGPALQLIFKHLPQRHRLGHGSCCALVCSSWAAAAAAATGSIVLEQCADTDSLQLWLHRHGHNLTQLHVSAASGMLTQLPCPKLTDLLLQGDSLLAAPDLAAVLAGLPSLQHLSLKESTIVKEFSWETQLRLLEHLPPVLLQLPQGVTYLELCGGLSHAAVQGLGSLTNCSHLVLKVKMCDDQMWLSLAGL